MAQAAFSFIGTEVVAVSLHPGENPNLRAYAPGQIAGAEVKNPRRNIPKAIKRVYIRLLLFYIGGVTVIGLLVPSNDDRLNLNDGTAAASPFVIAISNAGIKALPSVRFHALRCSPLTGRCAWWREPADLPGFCFSDNQRSYSYFRVVCCEQRPVQQLSRSM